MDRNAFQNGHERKPRPWPKRHWSGTINNLLDAVRQDPIHASAQARPAWPEDEVWMARALELAAKGVGTASPNPCVGAIVVRDGTVVGQGFHRKAGEPHAEVHALREAGSLARGATLYVTLEPCSHHGRTPPCAEAIIAAGIQSVVVAVVDPNPKVAGRGLQRLRDAGIEVRLGAGALMAERLNEAFLFAITAERPFIHLKWAMTLDGKSATAQGESRWITGPAARRKVHELRACHDAVLVGGETLRKDDPRLDVRDFVWPDARDLQQPARVVVTNRPVNLSQRAFARAGRAIVLFGRDPGEPHREALTRHGIQSRVFVASDGLDWQAALRWLAEQEFRSILVEAGPTLAGELLRKDLVERVSVFVAMRILGGAASKPAVGGPTPDRLTDAIRLRDVETTWLDGDLWVTGRICSRA